MQGFNWKDMIKGLIFDYGGTLDTGGNHWGKVIWHAYEELAVGVKEADFREAYVHAERTLGKNPIIQSDYTFEQVLYTKIKIEMEHLVDMGCLKDISKHKEVADALYRFARSNTQRSVETLKSLAEEYPMALVSNFYGNVSVVLQEMGFEGLFRKVIESAAVGIRKPDSRIFALGVEALDMKPEEVLVVGDSMDKEIVPAKQIGCSTLWIKGEGWTNEETNEQSADGIICDISQVKEFLNNN